jgi:hypothetical protein
MIYRAAHAQADLIECEYPAIGQQVQVDVALIHAEGFYCDFPTEINGSHRHCEQGAGGVGGAIQGNGLGSTFAFGGSGWSCSYRCPDLQKANWPNPPGAWNKEIHPPPCQPVGPAPPPFGIQPLAEPTPPETGVDTNPTPPNPDSLQPTGN